MNINKYAIHSVLVLRPWMLFVKHEEGIKTVKDNYNIYAAYQQRAAYDHLYSFNDDYDDERDDDLIPTI